MISNKKEYLSIPFFSKLSNFKKEFPKHFKLQNRSIIRPLKKITNKSEYT
jgi:hypothetical protein